MILLILKGIIIGFFMLFPGLSGGSVAIILDEYDKMIFHTSRIFKNFKNSLNYLFFIGFGGVIGLVISSKIIGYFTNNFYNETIYFFLGIMLVFIIEFIQKNTNKKINTFNLLYLGIGITVSVLIKFIPENIFLLNSFFSMMIFGILLAIALILPGISFSYILMIFSCYDLFINAISNYDLLFLIKVGIFLIFGIAVTIKTIEKCLTNYETKTNFLISGFMIGSFVSFIKIPKDITEINIMVVFLMTGILFFLIFGKIVKK